VTLRSRILSQTYNARLFSPTTTGPGLDFYIKWRVKERATTSGTGGSEDIGAGVGEIVKDGIKASSRNRTLEQIVSSERAAVTVRCLVRRYKNVAGLGRAHRRARAGDQPAPTK